MHCKPGSMTLLSVTAWDQWKNLKLSAEKDLATLTSYGQYEEGGTAATSQIWRPLLWVKLFFLQTAPLGATKFTRVNDQQ